MTEPECAHHRERDPGRQRARSPKRDARPRTEKPASKQNALSIFGDSKAPAKTMTKTMTCATWLMGNSSTLETTVSAPPELRKCRGGPGPHLSTTLDEE